MNPIEKFLADALKEFEQHLLHEKGLKEGAKEHRIRGARQFSEFILGRKYPKWARIKRPN